VAYAGLDIEVKESSKWTSRGLLRASKMVPTRSVMVTAGSILSQRASAGLLGHGYLSLGTERIVKFLWDYSMIWQGWISTMRYSCVGRKARSWLASYPTRERFKLPALTFYGD